VSAATNRDANAWRAILTELPATAASLQGVALRRSDAVDLIEYVVSPQTLLYFDPPSYA
jgi:hypothetical protein